MKEISEKLEDETLKAQVLKEIAEEQQLKNQKHHLQLKQAILKNVELIRELEKRDRDINLLNKKIEYYQKRLKQREEEDEKEKMEENSFKINKNKNEKNDINENNIEDDNKFKEDLTKKFIDYEEFKIKDFSKLSSINNLQKDKNTIDNDNDTLENISQFFNEKKETAKFEVRNDNNENIINKNNLNKDKIDSNGSFTDSLILTANGDINNNIIFIGEKEENNKINEKESKKENIKIQSFLET